MNGAGPVVGLGADLVDLLHFSAALTRTPRLRQRLFTDGERAYCDDRADSVQRFAVRFAAKEAVMKALGVGLGAFAFQEVEVVRAPSGAPSLVLVGAAADLAQRRGVERWWLSTSHTPTAALALVVATGPGQDR